MCNCARSTHLTLDSSEDKWFHNEFSLRNTVPLKTALLLVGFLCQTILDGLDENTTELKNIFSWSSFVVYKTSHFVVIPLETNNLRRQQHREPGCAIKVKSKAPS